VDIFAIHFDMSSEMIAPPNPMIAAKPSIMPGS
jgi:hypothetical protein